MAKLKRVFALVITAEPAEGGEVEADRFYEAGPNAGWSFVNWTQNGTQVSTATNFQFNVTGNRELVGATLPGATASISAPNQPAVAP